MAPAPHTTTTNPATLPATVPTTHPAIEVDSRQGDLILQVADKIGDTGLPQTFAMTPATSWLLLIFATLLGYVAARMTQSMHRRAALRAIEKAKLVRAVLLNSTGGPLGLFFFMLGLGTGLSFLRITPFQRAFLVGTFQLANVVIVGWLFYNLVDLVALALTRWSRGRQGKLSAMLVPLVRKVLRTIIIVVFALFVAENIFNADVGALLAGLGLAGLAVSLAAQDSIKHLFGSITLFADGPFAIGDLVRVDPYEGVVEDIGFRSTRLRTADGFVVSIPNGTVANAPILNLSRRPAIRRTIDLALPAATTSVTSLRKGLSILRDVLADPTLSKEIDASREPARVSFEELKTDQHRVRVTYRYRGNDLSAYLAHAEQMNLAIIERLGAAGIAFAIDPNTSSGTT